MIAGFICGLVIGVIITCVICSIRNKYECSKAYDEGFKDGRAGTLDGAIDKMIEAVNKSFEPLTPTLHRRRDD